MLSRPDAESLNFWRACCSSCRGKRRLYCSELLEEKPQQEDFWIDFRRWKSGGKRRNSEQWWKWISHTPCLSDHRISNLKVANWASLKPSLFLLRGSPHCLGGGTGGLWGHKPLPQMFSALFKNKVSPCSAVFKIQQFSRSGMVEGEALSLFTDTLSHLELFCEARDMEMVFLCPFLLNCCWSNFS